VPTVWAVVNTLEIIKTVHRGDLLVIYLLMTAESTGA
jgi:hypothetical protein